MKTDVDNGAIVSMERDARLLGALKAGVRHANSIGAERQVRKVVLSIVGRRYRASEAGGHGRDCHLGTSDSGALLVSHTAAQGSSGGLRLHDAGSAEHEQQSTAQREDRVKIKAYAGQPRSLVLHSFTHLEELVQANKARRQGKEMRAICRMNPYSTHPELRLDPPKNCRKEANTFLLGAIYSPAGKACQVKIMIFQRKIMLFYGASKNALPRAS